VMEKKRTLDPAVKQIPDQPSSLRPVHYNDWAILLK
jgi:hypothetical protein